MSYNEDEAGEVTLIFEDGKTTTCDLLVGADGLKSVVRKQFVKSGTSDESSGDPVWSGSFAYRCMINSDIVSQRVPDHHAFKTPVIVSGTTVFKYFGRILLNDLGFMCSIVERTR